MRILYLAHRIPFPPDKGDKIRAYHEICGLSARGHDVHVAAFADDPRDLRHGDNLGAVCASVTVVPLNRRRATLRSILALPARQALSLRFFASAAMHARVQERIDTIRPDAIVVYCSAMTQYIPAHLAGQTVVDLVDADSEKWRDYAAVVRAPKALIYRLEAHRLLRHERDVVRTFAHSLVTTPREAAIIDPSAAERLQALANGVNLDRFRPDLFAVPADAVPAGERRHFSGRGPRVVFVGAMDYFANVDAVTGFCRDVWPRIRATYPGATFLIVGANPAKAVRQLGRQAGVVVTGTVEDVRPYLAAATVAVAPLRIARGVQNKVFEAMAAGVPVVASPSVAAGMTAVPGRDVLIGATAGEFAAAVLSVIKDRQLRDRLARRGREFVEREHQWDAMLARFVRLVESVSPEKAALCA